jgi:hypothetical protein
VVRRCSAALNGLQAACWCWACSAGLRPCCWRSVRWRR